MNDTVEYRYRAFTSIAILRYIEYRTSPLKCFLNDVLKYYNIAVVSLIVMPGHVFYLPCETHSVKLLVMVIMARVSLHGFIFLQATNLIVSAWRSVLLRRVRSSAIMTSTSPCQRTTHGSSTGRTGRKRRRSRGMVSDHVANLLLVSIVILDN